MSNVFVMFCLCFRVSCEGAPEELRTWGTIPEEQRPGELLYGVPEDLKAQWALLKMSQVSDIAVESWALLAVEIERSYVDFIFQNFKLFEINHNYARTSVARQPLMTSSSSPEHTDSRGIWLLGTSVHYECSIEL